ncbi:hypothetical protein V1478_001988, partial [Vespula squamosa]
LKRANLFLARKVGREGVQGEPLPLVKPPFCVWCSQQVAHRVRPPLNYNKLTT